jgi:transcriptional regulator with XRE-family HTH domain
MNLDDYRRTLGARLTQLRSEKGVSRRQVAVTTGMTEQTVVNAEKAERLPSPATALRLADYYGVTLDYLFGRQKKAVR